MKKVHYYYKAFYVQKKCIILKKATIRLKTDFQQKLGGPKDNGMAFLECTKNWYPSHQHLCTHKPRILNPVKNIFQK